jgi:hypothetical protein
VIPYTDNMPQCATYWAPGGNDGWGGITPAPPKAIACRWQDKAQMFRTPEGLEVVSQSIVYTSEDVKVGGHLLLGDTQARTPTLAARQVRQVDKSPSLDGDRVLHKAYL